MKTKNRLAASRILIVVIIGFLLLAIWPSLGTRADILPPLPPLTTPGSPGAAGGMIKLHASFPKAWSWGTTHWQEPWTVVQWQDEKGAWHDVEGWRGTLDDVEIGKDGTVIGLKTWWVMPEDYGTGPFRWLVYRNEGGRVLATSELFDLPEANRAVKDVQVSLAMP